MDKDPLIQNNNTATPPPYYAPTNPPPPAQAYGSTYTYAQQPQHIVVEHGQVIPIARPIVPDYTVLAIIATVCFFPLGLVALSLARRSKESAHRGDAQSAYSDALSARIISRLSMSIGTFIITGTILAIVLPTYIYY